MKLKADDFTDKLSQTSQRAKKDKKKVDARIN